MGPASHSASHNYPRRASEWRAPSWARCCGLLSADINLQLAPNIALEQLAASLCGETKTPPTHSHVSGRSSLFDSVRFKFSLVTLCPPPPPAPSMLLCLDEPFVPLIDCSLVGSLVGSGALLARAGTQLSVFCAEGAQNSAQLLQ